MKPYNGHRSWNAWNVALWLSNDESLYRLCMDCLEAANSLNHAVNLVYYHLGNGYEKTPDGAQYNRLSIKLALSDLAND